ncbi:MAG: iron-containing alcohol dehydrogenase, partial [Candidatus Izimaplasma sp.]|nr:iron-containing alcohol dehydrogenase [Candidatus Izimaplasma bacterium]
VYEFYFSNEKSYLNDRICEAIMKTIIYYGPIALKEPDNYEARANLMFSSTLALNGLTGFSKDFEGFNHITEHVLSAYYDIAHGDGLSILAPHWMKHIINEDNIDKFYEFAVNVWGIEPEENTAYVAAQGISKVFEFYRSLGMPLSLKEVGIVNADLDQLAAKAVKGETLGKFVKLTKEDVKDILTYSE